MKSKSEDGRAGNTENLAPVTQSAKPSSATKIGSPGSSSADTYPSLDHFRKNPLCRVGTKKPGTGAVYIPTRIKDVD